jgi:Na+/serine symporter
LVVDVIVGIAFTVTITTAEGSDEQARLLWVATAILLYCVVAVSPDGASYVAAVAPLMVPQLLNGLTALSHR